MTRFATSRRFTLRWTIASLVVALLVLTVAGTMGIALFLRGRTLEMTTEILQKEIYDILLWKVRDRFGPLLEVLRECVASAESGVVDVDDPEAFAAWLVERARFDDRFELLAFLRPDGSGVGAIRSANRDVRLLSGESGDDGEMEVRFELRRADGSREVLSAEGIDLSSLEGTPMFALGAGSDVPAWTAPYQRRIDGSMGRAGVFGYRRGDELVGVFAIGVGTAFLQEFVRGLDVGERGRVFFLAPDDGSIRVTPSAEDQRALGPIVEAALRELPDGIDGLGENGAYSTSIRHDGTTYVVGLSRRRPAGLPLIAHALVIPEEELVGYLGRHLVWGLAGVLGFLALSTFLAHVISRRVSKPLRAITEDLERIGAFDLSGEDYPVSRIREVTVLAEATRRMKASLRSFGRYVPQDVVRALVAAGEEARLGGEVRTLSLFFSDVANFTSASEGIEPHVLVESLGDYLEVVTSSIQDVRGTVDKFIGDGVLAFFNAPLDDVDHARHACLAALEVQRRLAENDAAWQAAGHPSFATRIGLHVDEVLVGNIGTPDRFGYTVIGDGVNLAARLESLNKAYGTRILGSEAMRRAVGDAFEWRAVDRTAVKGRQAGGVVYELLGETGAVSDGRRKARDVYERAFDAYLTRDFEAAARGFDEASGLRPADEAARLLAKRARDYAANPPPPDWNGVYVQTRK